MGRIPVTERRTLLVDAAIRVASREGLAATTTRLIAAEAGVSLGIVHYCFTSKEELLADVIRTITDEHMRAASDALLPGRDVTAATREALHGFWALVEATPERQQLTYELTSWAVRRSETAHLAREQHARNLANAERLIRQIAEFTDATWTLPLAQLARMAITVTDGVTLAWLVDGDSAAALATLDAFATFLANYAA